MLKAADLVCVNNTEIQSKQLRESDYIKRNHFFYPQKKLNC